MEYLFEDVKLGDVKAAYAHVVRVYKRKTSTLTFRPSSMHGDHVDLDAQNA